jgi:hypothetical protein
MNFIYCTLGIALGFLGLLSTIRFLELSMFAEQFDITRVAISLLSLAMCALSIQQGRGTHTQRNNPSASADYEAR